MTNAKRDENAVAVGLAVSSVDNATPLQLRVDPVTDYLLVSVALDSLSPTSATRCKRDENGAPTKYGVSSTDGITIVPIRTDSSGTLLVTLT